MIDHKKRNTLKTLSVTAGTLFVAGTPLAAVLNTDSTGQSPHGTGAIQVSTCLSVENNDIEIVLTNTTNQAITLTKIVPGSTRVARGEFNYSKLFDKGPMVLAEHSAVTIPLTRKPVAINTAITSDSGSLHDTLRQSLAVITERGAASVTLASSMAIA